MTFLQWLFCKHRNLAFVRNIYGDEINHCGGYRSLWHCPDCKMEEYRRELHEPEYAPHWPFK